MLVRLLLLVVVLAAPAAAQAPDTTLRASGTAICGQPPLADSGGIIAGIIRHAKNREPIAGVTVVGEWLELSINRAGFTRRVPRTVVTTGEDGRFALCNAPRPGTVEIVATRGADSTDVIEVQVPVVGLLLRDLFLGTARTVVIGDAMIADTLAPPPRRVHTGDGRLSGTVVTAAGAKPLAGARVSITNGPETRANDRGEWTLLEVPPGTRMLEIRAVGYYPERVAVDVVEGAAPVRTALPTMAAVLQTVKIRASRVNDRNVAGFAERRHMGMGRYLTHEDVARRQPIFTSDLFRMIPGIRLDRVGLADTRISMRGIFADRCAPAVYLDGHYMRGLSADDINAWVSPDAIAGIEIYSPGTVPAQFEPGMSGCGSIVIWTRRAPGPGSGRPLKQRIFTLIGAVTLGLLVGAALQ